MNFIDNYFKGYFRYGQVLLKLSKYDEAIEYFKQASTLVS